MPPYCVSPRTIAEFGSILPTFAKVLYPSYKIHMVARVLLVAALAILAGSETTARQTLTNCGGEYEAPCDHTEADAHNRPCDAGLKLMTKNCGCLEYAPLFNVCLVWQVCLECRNDTRAFMNDGKVFSRSWISWALDNQRKQLAYDEPINWVARLGAHNAYNAYLDHYPFAQQFYSMTDQLNLGARTLAIDVWMVDGRARLCHTDGSPEDHCPRQSPPGGLSGGGMRYFSNGIKEIGRWLKRHPGAILILEIQSSVDGTSSDHVTKPLHRYLGETLLPEAEGPTGENSPARWPTRREMLTKGRRVIVFSKKKIGFPKSFVSRSYNQPGYNPDFDHCSWYEDYYDPNSKSAQTIETIGDAQFVKLAGQQLVPYIGPPFAYDSHAPLHLEDIAGAVRCGCGIIDMDFFSRSPDHPPRVTTYDRQAAAIWSWKQGDKGDRGDCAMLESSSQRWVSRNCSDSHAYACAPQRPIVDGRVGPRDRTESAWRITTYEGPWRYGDDACEEFASEGDYVFAVPVNGYQNTKLLDRMGSPAPSGVWLNYTDQESEGHWRLPEIDQAGANAPPRADAGPDQVVECGDDVILDGSASMDPDGDPLTYEWTGPFGTLEGEHVEVRLGVGVHTIDLLVSDGTGWSDTDSVSIDVRDTLPPTISVSLSPTALWPPDHRMVDVTAGIVAEDACDAAPPLARLESITSNQEDDGAGDGHTTPDISDAEIGAGDLEFMLRAERSGRDSNRLYTVCYDVSDSTGNVAEQCQTVSVPRSNGRPRRD